MLMATEKDNLMPLDIDTVIDREKWPVEEAFTPTLNADRKTDGIDRERETYEYSNCRTVLLYYTFLNFAIFM